MKMKLFRLILLQFLFLTFEFAQALKQNDMVLLDKLPPAMGSNGTLIDPNWILTSTSLGIPETIIIGGIKRKVDKAITHPLWIPGETSYDLQLLHLSYPITEFKPIKLLRNDLLISKEQCVILLGANLSFDDKVLNLDDNRQACNHLVSNNCSLFRGLPIDEIFNGQIPSHTFIRHFEPYDGYDLGAGIFVKYGTKTADRAEQYYLIFMCTNVKYDEEHLSSYGINSIFRGEIVDWIDKEIEKEISANKLSEKILNAKEKTFRLIEEPEVEPLSKKELVKKPIIITEQPLFMDFIPADYENFVQGMLYNYLATLIDPNWIVTLSNVELPKEIRINKKTYKIDFKINYPKNLDRYKRKLTLAHLKKPVEHLCPIRRKRLVNNEIIDDSLILITAKNEFLKGNKDNYFANTSKIISEIQLKDQKIDKKSQYNLECVPGSGLYGPLPKEKINLLSKLPQFLLDNDQFNRYPIIAAYENIFNDPLAEIKPSFARNHKLFPHNNKTYAAKLNLYALASVNNTTSYINSNSSKSNIFWLTKKFNSWIDHQILVYNLQSKNVN